METIHQNMQILWPWKQSARSRSLVAYNLLFCWLRILYTKSFHLDKLCLSSSQLNIEFANKISAKSDNYNIIYSMCPKSVTTFYCIHILAWAALSNQMPWKAWSPFWHTCCMVTCSSDLLSITTWIVSFAFSMASLKSVATNVPEQQTMWKVYHKLSAK